MTDRDGAAVPDLTPADFVVKEGGKEREVVKAVPATQKMRLAVMAEERLLGDGGVRNGLFEFMKRLQPTAEIAFIAIGLRNTTVVNYTTDLNAMVAGFNGLSLNPPPQTNLTEGILDISKAIEKERHERPVIVVVAISGGQSGGASANEVLNQLRQSGAGMFAVTIATGGTAQGVGSLADDSNREQVIGDGAKQSGGRRIEVTATIAVGKGLQQVASDLTLSVLGAVCAARRSQTRPASERQPEAARPLDARAVTHPGPLRRTFPPQPVNDGGYCPPWSRS